MSSALVPPPARADPVVGGLGGLEIVGRHSVEKPLDLLHLVLTDGGGGLLVALVWDKQAGLGEHGFLDVDRNADPQRDRHRVRGARRYRDVSVEDQVSVKSAFLEIDDPHLFQRMPKRRNEIPDQVMRQRARRFNTLLLQRYRGSLGLTDPNWQVSVTVDLAQQQHRLVLRLLHANADNTNFTHLCLPSAPAAVISLHSRRGDAADTRSPRRRTPSCPTKSNPQRCRTSRTADLINDVCSVMASAATRGARRSARSGGPALTAWHLGR